MSRGHKVFDYDEGTGMWSAVTATGSTNGNSSDPIWPSARTKHSVTLLGGCLYLLGGRNGSVPLKDMWKYTLSEGKWEQLKPTGDSPPSLQEHTAVAHRGGIYVFGGEVGFSSTETPLWFYDVTKNDWRKVTSRRGAAVPRGRRGHTALVHEGAMLIYGGYQDLKGSLNDLWAFYFESESWHLLSSNSSGGVIPPGRHKHSAVFQEGSMWVYGGMQDLHERADFWKWDTASSQWYQIRSKFNPGPRHSHAACRLPGCMFLFGGETNGQPTNELWRFHFATEMWEKIHASGVKPQPRSESIAVAISELQLQGDPSSTPQHHGSRGRPRVQRCLTAPDKNRNPTSTCIPINKVSPCERTYVFKASNLNYVDGSPAPEEPKQISSPTPNNSSGSFLKEFTKLSQMNISRLGHNKCSYSVLTSNNDSTESLIHQQQQQQQNKEEEDWSQQSNKYSMVKSQSAHVINRRRTIMSGLISPVIPEVGTFNYTKSYNSRHQASVNEWKKKEMPREPISVPNFSDLTLPTPVLTPVEAARLVFLDSEEEDGYTNDVFEPTVDDHDIVQVVPPRAPSDFAIIHKKFQPNIREDSYSSHLGSYANNDNHHTYENVPKQISIIPKSTSVRFQNCPEVEEVSDENSTSDYASIEGVNRTSSNSTYSMSTRHSFTPLEENTINEFSQMKLGMKHSDTAFGFCNPNYLGPDIHTILATTPGQTQDIIIDPPQMVKALNTPDSGITDSRSGSRQLFLMEDMVEMQDFGSNKVKFSQQIDLKTSRERHRRLPPRSLTIESPCSPYQTKDIGNKTRAKSASRAERQRYKEPVLDEEIHDMTCFSSDIVIPLYIFIIGGKEHGQVNVFKRPLSVWKYQLY